MYTNIHIYKKILQIYKNVKNTEIYMYTCKHKYIYTNIRLCKYTYMYIYIDIHACM